MYQSEHTIWWYTTLSIICTFLVDFEDMFVKLGYTTPLIIRTFLETYDFSGKVIVSFATFGGSGLGDTAKTLQELVPAAVVKDGKLLNGRSNAEELKKWADSFGN